MIGGAFPFPAPQRHVLLMTAGAFGCHDIRGRGRTLVPEIACSPQPERTCSFIDTSVVFCVYCTRVGCYWRRVGGTLGRWGLRAVGTTLGQWIPTLVEQADPRRDSKRGRSQTMTTGPLRRWRAGDGGEDL